jgi:hypothetical protein
MPSPHFPMLDIQPLVFELLHSVWSWAHLQQDPSIAVKAPMRMEHSGLNTHTMLSTNKPLTPPLPILTLNNKLLRLTTNKGAMYLLHRLTLLSQLLGVLVLLLHLLGNQRSLLDLIDMLPLIQGIVIMMNLRNLNTRIDIPTHRLLMSGKQDLMRLITPDLVDLRVLEVTPDQVYLISPPTQRWFIITIITIIIIRPKDLLDCMVIRPLPLLLLRETGIWEEVGVMWVDHLFHPGHRTYMLSRKGERFPVSGRKQALRLINLLLVLLLLRMIGI